MTRALLTTLAVVSLAACQPSPAPSVPAEAASQTARSPAEQLIGRSPGALVVDVRTPGEFTGGHVAGARNVDVTGDGFEAALDTVDRSRPVFLYCRTGNRSGRAKELLDGMGFQNVVNAGGFDALAAAGVATESTVER